MINNVGTTKYQPLPLVTDLGVIQTSDKKQKIMPQLESHPTVWHSFHLADKAPDRAGANCTNYCNDFFMTYRGSFQTFSSLIGLLPLCSHGCHGVNAHKHCRDGEPVLKPAEFLPKIPDIVTGIDKIEDGVEGGHQQVGKSQVNDEVIGGGPHPPVRQDNPDDGDIANDGCDNDEGVGDGPQSDPPSWLGELGCRRPVAAVLEGASLRNIA